MNKKIKTLNVSSTMENSPKMKKEKFEFNASAILCGHTWAVPQQRTLSISVAFINRIKAEMHNLITKHNLKNMTFIAKNYFIL